MVIVSIHSKGDNWEVLDVGIRNINSLLTVGRGQRLGIVAGSGSANRFIVNDYKSTDADVVVVSLIGEEVES